MYRFALALFSSVIAVPAGAQIGGMSIVSAHAFSFETLDGGTLRLAAHAGKPILVVNTASLCGYTPQYAGLQQLWTRFRDRGLAILAVPSNDFGGQEPGGADVIAQVTHQHGVTFPTAAKAVVKGADAHPFYRWAALQRPLDTPRWNFHKYLLGRDGRITAVFGSAIEPTDPRVVAAIERELAP